MSRDRLAYLCTYPLPSSWPSCSYREASCTTEPDISGPRLSCTLSSTGQTSEHVTYTHTRTHKHIHTHRDKRPQAQSFVCTARVWPILLSSESGRCPRKAWSVRITTGLLVCFSCPLFCSVFICFCGRFPFEAQVDCLPPRGLAHKHVYSKMLIVLLGCTDAPVCSAARFKYQGITPIPHQRREAPP